MEMLVVKPKDNKPKKTSRKFIPADWRLLCLEDAVEFLDGKRRPIKDADRAKMRGIYPYYGASGIIDYVNDYIFNDNLILLGEDGANIVNRSTPLAFIVSGKCWVNNHAQVLKPKANFDIGFLVNYLESISYEKYNTGTAQPKLNKEVCSKIPVPAPSLQEQQLIASVLFLWDKAIDKTQKLIDQIKLRNKGLAQQLLTGKKRLKGFEGEWKSVKVRDVFEEIKESNDGGVHHQVMTISSTLGLISQEDKFDRVIAGESLGKYTLLNEGDFAYNKGNSKTYPMGCVYQLDEGSALVPFVYICFRPTQKVHSRFYRHWFFHHGLDHQLKQIITSGARGDGLLNVNKMDFFNLKLPYPKKEEQKQMAELLDAGHLELSHYQDKLRILKDQKKGLMQKLLTGELRVKI